MIQLKMNVSMITWKTVKFNKNTTRDAAKKSSAKSNQKTDSYVTFVILSCLRNLILKGI